MKSASSGASGEVVGAEEATRRTELRHGMRLVRGGSLWLDSILANDAAEDDDGARAGRSERQSEVVASSEQCWELTMGRVTRARVAWTKKGKGELA